MRHLVLLAFSLGVLGCSGDDTTAGPPDAGAEDAAPDASAFDAGGGDAAAEDAAASDAAPSDAGARDATADGGGSRGALVSGGTRSKSANFALVGAVGQSPGGNTASTSPGHRLRGGIVGATQVR